MVESNFIDTYVTSENTLLPCWINFFPFYVKPGFYVSVKECYLNFHKADFSEAEIL